MHASITPSPRAYRQPPALAYQVWLSGGQIAVYSHSDRQILHSAGLNAPVFASARIPQPDMLFQSLAACGLPLIGVTALQTRDEVDGRSVPAFMAWRDHEYWWGARIAHQRWQMVAHGADLAGRTDLHDLAERIVIALDDSQARLGELCRAYALQLAAATPEERREPLRCFSNTHSQQVYLHIHGLFWQMGVLRDLLAEYAAAQVLALPGIGSLAGLVKKLRQAPSPSPIAAALLSATDAGGWIAAFTAYRNLFTHAAPLQSAQGPHYIWQDTRPLYGRPEPQIHYPLPKDPEGLVTLRSAGTLPVPPPDAPLQPPERNHQPDALEYLAGALDRFVDLAERLAATRPVKPELPTLTDEDIIHLDILDP